MKNTLEEFFAGDRLDVVLVDHIRHLKQNYTTAVLSNYSPRLRGKIFQLWQIADAFDHLIISAEVGVRKPDPKIYQITLEAVGCQADQAVFIDDVAENIAAAQSIGLHGIHFQSREQALRDLDSLLGKQ
jgi:putative hydrolase of the HAD superfamily